MLKSLFKIALFAGLVLLLFPRMAVAQDQHKNIEVLQNRLDSLKVLQAQFQEGLKAVEIQIAEGEMLLEKYQIDVVGKDDVVLMTNMEASIRSRPTPEGDMLLQVPANTPLIALSYDQSYWFVKYQGVEGWIMRLFVQEEEDALQFKKELMANNQVEAGEELANTITQERSGKHFLVTQLGIHEPDANGRVSLFYAFEHLDPTKTVREVTFSITPYNAGGEVEEGASSGASTKRLRRFGPIQVKDGQQHYQFDNVWVSNEIRCVEIDRVDIVYTDGSRLSHRQDVGSLLLSSIENNCAIPTAQQISGTEAPE